MEMAISAGSGPDGQANGGDDAPQLLFRIAHSPQTGKGGGGLAGAADEADVSCRGVQHLRWTSRSFWCPRVMMHT